LYTSHLSNKLCKTSHSSRKVRNLRAKVTNYIVTVSTACWRGPDKRNVMGPLVPKHFSRVWETAKIRNLKKSQDIQQRVVRIPKTWNYIQWDVSQLLILVTKINLFLIWSSCGKGIGDGRSSGTLGIYPFHP
jgi:hypothetical protein